MSGSMVRTIATFTSLSGGAANPDTVTLKYRVGLGTAVTVSDLSSDSTGVYHYDLDTTGFAGPDDQLWVTEWIGTGAVIAIGTDSFQVVPPVI